MSDVYDRLLAAQAAVHSDNFAPKMVQERMTVKRVERASTQRATLVVGMVNGEGEYPILPMDKDVNDGDTIIVQRPVTAQANALYEMVAVMESGSAAPTSLIPGTVLPAPDFNSPDSTTVLVAGPGVIGSKLTIRFVLIEAKYNQSATLVFYKLTTETEYTVERVATPNTEVTLSRLFVPGVSVDVYLRAESNGFAAAGLQSLPHTIPVATDTVSAGTASGVTVATNTPNQLVITPTGTFDPTYFDRFRYEIATVAAGTGATVLDSPGPLTYVTAPGTFYVRVRSVSKAGTLGQAYPIPPANFAGPYVVTGAFVPDTTPPGVMPAPTLTGQVVQYGDGTYHGFMTVSWAGYGFAADHKTTQIHIVCNDGRIWDEQVEGTGTSAKIEVGFGQFTISLRAEDTSGNTQAAFGSTTVATNTTPAAPTGTPTVTTITVGTAVLVAWTAVTDALGYYLQRADDNIGTNEVYIPSGSAVTAEKIDALGYLDMLRTTTEIAPSNRWYRVRAVNAAGVGPFSSRVQGTAGKIDAQNLRVDSIVAGLIAADIAIFNKVTSLGGVFTNLFATDIATANRVEMRGNAATGGDVNQIRFIERVSAADVVRARAKGDGFFLYGDAAQGDISMSRVSNRAQFTAHGVAIGHNGTNPFITINTAPSGGGLGQLRLAALWGTDVIQQGTYGSHDTHLWTRPGTGSDDPIAAFYDSTLSSQGKLGIWGNGIGASIAGGSDGITFRASATQWQASGPITATKLRAAATPSYFDFLQAVYQGTALGTTAGNTQDIAVWQYLSGTDRMSAVLQAYRGQAGSDRTDARFKLGSVWGNNTNAGGTLQLGFRGTVAFWSLGQGNTAELFLNEANTRIETTRNFTVGGALAKTSGSFVIPHPDPALTDTHELRHCFVESDTRGENVYTFVIDARTNEVGAVNSRGESVDIVGKVAVADDGAITVQIPLPDYWRHLNERPRVLTSLHDEGEGFGRSRGWVNADLDTLTVRMSEADQYVIMLIGTRKDKAARDWFDFRGIVKTKGQKWSNDNTTDLRAKKLEARERRNSRKGKGVALFPTFGERLEAIRTSRG
jgi:hypothetical protein